MFDNRGGCHHRKRLAEAATRSAAGIDAAGLTPNSPTTGDGALPHYEDRIIGPVLSLRHGYPLPSGALDYRMLFLSHSGYRVIVHDRRGRPGAKVSGGVRGEYWRQGRLPVP